MIRIVVLQGRSADAARVAEQAAQEAARAAQNAEQAARTAEQAREAADRQIEQAIRDADRAVEAAGGTTRAGEQPIIITKDNGKEVTIDFRDGNLVVSQEGTTKVIPWDRAVPSGAVDIAQALAATVFFLVIGWPIARAIAGWINRRGQVASQSAQLSRQLEERLQSMERNIDTVAVEMERLAEQQRFTTRLISERPSAVPVSVPVGVPTANGRS